MAFRHIVNLCNASIGTSILAMPFCFHTSGIFLSILTLIISGFINRFACHLIIRSARISKRKSFENLTFGVFGKTGKLITEIAILCFLLGSCIGFFIVIGDLGPSLISQLLNIPNYAYLRTFTMMMVAMFFALPLGLKRRVEASYSTISMFLYLLLAINLFFEASSKIIFSNSNTQTNDLFKKLNYWNFENYLAVLPIFITCLSCQPQLFEILDQSILFSEDKQAISRINKTIKQSISFCSILYIITGLFGYIAFFESSIEGNLLVNLPPTLFSILAKFGFLFTIILSLPLCLMPCRTSLHSLLYGKPTTSLLNEMVLTDTYIPDDQWIFLTVLLIVITICISIIIPHVEFMIALIGSTSGTIVCFIIPSLCFINLTFKNTNERLVAYFIFYFGVCLLIFSTFTLIQNVNQQELPPRIELEKKLNLSTNHLEELIEKNKLNQLDKINKKQLILDENNLNQINNKLEKEFNLKIDENLNKDKSDLIKKELDSSKNKEADNKNLDNEINKKESIVKQVKVANEMKENKILSNKEKSGFINAVESKKKSLSNEKIDKEIKEKIKDDLNKFKNQNRSLISKEKENNLNKSKNLINESKLKNRLDKLDSKLDNKLSNKLNDKLNNELDSKLDSKLNSKLNQNFDNKLDIKVDFKLNQFDNSKKNFDQKFSKNLDNNSNKNLNNLKKNLDKKSNKNSSIINKTIEKDFK